MCSDIIGKPFVDGGRGPDEFDCWGVVVFTYARLGVDLPHYAISAHDSAAISLNFGRERSIWKEIEPGHAAHPDVLAFRMDSRNPEFITHIGIYLEHGKFLHCLEKTGVIVSRLNDPYFSQRFAGAYSWTGGA